MKSPLGISRTIRKARRTREILTVLARYGFRNVIEELGLDTALYNVRKWFFRAKAEPHLARLPQTVRVRKVLEELGPTFVKLGQVLSLRPDLIPQDWADEFRKLQDDVPPVEFSRVKALLEIEYPKGLSETFKSIDEKPVAAASIAQVHRAVLLDGTPVVLKIMRPGIRDTLDADMSILRGLAEFAEEHFSDLGYSPIEVVDQFSKEIERETDMMLEGRSLDRFQRDFEENEHVHFPRVYWEVTTGSILAMEEVPGKALSKLKLDEMSREDLETIVKRGTDAVFRQCLETGFFHADPHPGNIFVTPECELYFIDCGMTGHADPRTTSLLSELVQAVITADLEQVIEVVITLGDADPIIAEDRHFRADAWEFVSRFENATLETLHMGDLLQDFFDKIRRNNLNVPSDIVFLIKAITTIESVGEWLAPDFDIVNHVRPHIERLIQRRYGFRAIRQRLQHSMTGYAQLAEELPYQVRGLLYGVRRNRITINLEHRGLERLTDTIDRASGHIAHSVFVASLIMGSSILVLADSVIGEPGVLSILAGIGLAIACALALGRVVANRFH